VEVDEPLIYREEVRSILIALADIVHTLDAILGALVGGGDDEEETE